MSVGGAIGVIPSLEASSLETHLGLMHFWSIGHGQQQMELATPLRGKLNGCCRALVAFAALMAAGGWRMFVRCGCLQQTMAAGIAWQLSVRRGTVSEDGTCSNGTVG